MTTAPCDKCRGPVDTAGWNSVACFDCTKVYVRCAACGGQAGARRSLHSHRALHHPALAPAEAAAAASRAAREHLAEAAAHIAAGKPR